MLLNIGRKETTGRKKRGKRSSSVVLTMGRCSAEVEKITRKKHNNKTKQKHLKAHLLDVTLVVVGLTASTDAY